MKNNEENKYLTTHQAAKLLFVTPTTVIAWANRGKIKYMKTIGNHRRIPATEVERLLREAEVRGNQELS
jgi:excisionase family DNA binding protein